MRNSILVGRRDNPRQSLPPPLDESNAWIADPPARGLFHADV
jgi:hypothetical protein